MVIEEVLNHMETEAACNRVRRMLDIVHKINRQILKKKQAEKKVSYLRFETFWRSSDSFDFQQIGMTSEIFDCLTHIAFPDTVWDI